MFDDNTLNRLQPTVSDDDKPTTPEQWAAIEFDALPPAPEVDVRFEKKRWAKESLELGNCLLMALAFARLSKPELTEAVRKGLDSDGELLFASMELFEAAAKDCSAFADLLTMAHTRLLACAAVVMIGPEAQP